MKRPNFGWAAEELSPYFTSLVSTAIKPRGVSQGINLAAYHPISQKTEPSRNFGFTEITQETESRPG